MKVNLLKPPAKTGEVNEPGSLSVPPLNVTANVLASPKKPNTGLAFVSGLTAPWFNALLTTTQPFAEVWLTYEEEAVPLFIVSKSALPPAVKTGVSGV